VSETYHEKTGQKWLCYNKIVAQDLLLAVTSNYGELSTERENVTRSCIKLTLRFQ